MTIVNADELIAYMDNINLDDAQRALVENDILPGVQGELERWCNRPVEKVHVRETLTTDYMGIIRPTVSPVWQTLSVVDFNTNNPVPFTAPPVQAQITPSSEDIRVIDLSEQSALPYEITVISGAYPNVGDAFLTQGGIPIYGQYPIGTVVVPQYVVEYIAGYDGTVDKTLRMDILRVAARECERQFTANMQISDGQAANAKTADGRQKAWTQDELNKYGRLKRRVVV